MYRNGGNTVDLFIIYDGLFSTKKLGGFLFFGGCMFVYVGVCFEISLFIIDSTFNMLC